MWNDFVEAFGDRFEKKDMFAKTSLFVSELKTWIEWHDKAAQQKMHQTAFGVGMLCLFVGYLAGWLIFAFKFGGW